MALNGSPLATLLSVGELLAQELPETRGLRSWQREGDPRVTVSYVRIAQAAERQKHAISDSESLNERLPT